MYILYLVQIDPRQKHEPRITIRTSNTRAGIPNIDIVFPNGHEDTMVLHRHYDSPQARMDGKLHCNFFGHLKNDREACVAVTGCQGQEDMEFTINSKHSTHTNLYILEKTGKLRSIESPLKVYSNYSIYKNQDYTLVLGRSFSFEWGKELSFN